MGSQSQTRLKWLSMHAFELNKSIMKREFPGGSVVKNQPARAGDNGVRSLVQEDLTCCGAMKPVGHNYWVCALEPVGHHYWSPCPVEPVLCNQEKPLQWEDQAPTREKPAQPALTYVYVYIYDWKIRVGPGIHGALISGSMVNKEICVNK